MKSISLFKSSILFTYFLIGFLSLIIFGSIIAIGLIISEVGITPIPLKSGDVWLNIRRSTVSIFYGDRFSSTGVVIDKSGIILTAAHCLHDYEIKDLRIVFSDGRTVIPQCYFQCDNIDIGFIFLSKRCYSSVSIGDFSSVKFGQDLWMVGHPIFFADFPSIHKGILSRMFIAVDYPRWSNLFQADFAAYPGNSGSGVFVADGSLVGIFVGFPAYGETPAQCLSYCIPINSIKLDLAFYISR